MLRLFMSVDMAGSTDYKARFADSPDVGWLRVFEAFFQIFPIVLIGQIAVEFFDEAELPSLRVWKVLGDEIIFTSEPETGRDTALLLRALFSAMARYETQHLAEMPLHLKATAWSASFPSPNVEIEIPEMSHGVTYVDYLGRDIDLGFRIARFAQPSAIVVSHDLLEMLLAANAPFDYFQAGDEPLTGFNRGRPYPIILARPVGEAFAIENGAALYPRLVAALKDGPADPDTLREIIAASRAG